MDFALALAVILETAFPSNEAVAAAAAKLRGSTSNPPEEPEDPEDPGDPEEPEEPDMLPSELIDVSSWKLHLDRQVNGDKTGTSPTIYSGYGTPTLEEFYSDQFKVNEAGDAVLIAADVDGIKTSSSTLYARTEFHSTWPYEDDNTAPDAREFLPSSGEVKLEAEFEVVEWPFLEEDDSEGRICIARVHGPSDELCAFYIDMNDPDGSFYYTNDKSVENGIAPQHQKLVLRGPDGERAAYTGGKVALSIHIKDEIMVVSADYDGMTYEYIEPLSSFWRDENAWCHFKVGVYLAQHSDEEEEEGVRGYGRAEALFYDITATYGSGLDMRRN